MDFPAAVVSTSSSLAAAVKSNSSSSPIVSKGTRAWGKNNNSQSASQASSGMQAEAEAAATKTTTTASTATTTTTSPSSSSSSSSSTSNQLQHRVSSLERENARLQATLNENIELIRKEYAMKLDRAERDKVDGERALRSELKSLLNEREELNRTIQELSLELGKARQALDEKAKSGQRAHRSARDAAATVDEFKKDLELMGEEMRTLQEENLRLRRDARANAEAKEDAEAQVDGLKQSMLALNVALEGTQRELQSVKDAFDQSLAALPDDERENRRETSAQSARLFEEVRRAGDVTDRLRLELDSVKQASQKHSAALQRQLETAEKAVEEERRRAAEQLESLQRTTMADSSRHLERIQTLERELSESKAACVRAETLLERETALVSEKETKFKALGQHATQLRSRCEELERQLRQSEENARTCESAQRKAVEDERRAAEAAKEAERARDDALRRCLEAETAARDADDRCDSMQREVEKALNRVKETDILLADRQLYMKQVSKLSEEKARLEEAQEVTDTTIYSLMSQIERLTLEKEAALVGRGSLLDSNGGGDRRRQPVVAAASSTTSVRASAPPTTVSSSLSKSSGNKMLPKFPKRKSNNK